MKPKTSEELLKKARRAYQDPQPSDLPLPPGFANQAVSRLTKTPRILVWERVSYVGVALAACLTVMAWVSSLETSPTVVADTGNAADLWLDMPMNKDF